MALEDRFIIRRIQNHVDQGINGEEGDVTQVRQAMFQQYQGDESGNEREGFSRFVTSELFQAIEWALPAFIRVFMGGIRPVEFKPLNAADVQQAKLETEVVAQWFFEAPDGGFMTVYSWLKDILLYPYCYIKISPEEEAVIDTQSFERIPAAQIDAFEEEGAEVFVDKEYEGEDAYDVTVSTDRTDKRVAVMPIPPDHCIIEHGWASLDLDGCPFVCIRTQKTYSDLRKLGYEEDELADLAPDDNETWNDEGVTRHFYSDELPEGQDDAFDIQADELYWVHECYMHIDVDEDGISEPRKVVMVGCKILENEELDFMPVVAASAIPQTHKHIGMSYAEAVADLQKLMTTLTRQLLDNIYKQNVQRTFVSEQSMLTDNRTMDALLDGRSEVIVVRGSPAEAVLPETTTPIVAEIAGVIEQFKDAPQLRTGIAPQISLDPSVLEKSTMGAFVGALEQASQRSELLARIFAETGLKKAFQKIHYVLRNYFDTAQDVEVQGTWQQIDPSKWKRRPNMSVNVGIGFNNKQMMLTLLSETLKVQKEAMGFGLATEKEVYNTLEKIIEQANLGHATTYFVDPKQPGWQKPEPKKDPAMIAAEAQAEALKAEAARKDKELDAKIANDKTTLDAKIAADKEKAAVEAMKGNQALMGHKLEVVKAEDDRALNAATITKANRDDKAQGGPAKDSSSDEYDFAKSSIKGGS